MKLQSSARLLTLLSFVFVMTPLPVTAWAQQPPAPVEVPASAAPVPSTATSAPTSALAPANYRRC